MSGRIVTRERLELVRQMVNSVHYWQNPRYNSNRCLLRGYDLIFFWRDMVQRSAWPVFDSYQFVWRGQKIVGKVDASVGLDVTWDIVPDHVVITHELVRNVETASNGWTRFIMDLEVGKICPRIIS